MPIINEGSGTSEHPTQAILDLYTIYEKFNRFDNLHIMKVSNLKYGRTVKSHAKLLSCQQKKSKITFVFPKELKAPKDFVKELQKNIHVSQKTSFGNIIGKVDVIYMTRVQEEWFEK